MSGGLLAYPLSTSPYNFRQAHQTPLQPSTLPAFTKPVALASNAEATVSPNHLTMSGRKRKADDDAIEGTGDRMSASPSPSPAPSRLHSFLPSRQNKRLRTNVVGRPLSLNRLLETLDANEMRGVLRSICDRHPEIGAEIVTTAPRPTVQSALSILGSYQSSLQESFPYGDRPTSDYSYNRVRAALMDLLDALRDFTPSFLPPHQMQTSMSLAYLDGATEMIHQLPNWDTYQHNRHKMEAYEEIARAWAGVIREAAKKGGGFQVQYGGWDQKLAKHNDMSGGKMGEAMNELRSSIGWMGAAANEPGQGGVPGEMSIREQLFSGTYGTNAIQAAW